MLSSDNLIIFSSFAAIFISIAILELFFPFTKLSFNKFTRWYSNLGIAVINNIIVHLLVPITVINLAIIAEKNGVGVLNNLDIPYSISIVIAVVMLDLIIYLQHRLFHFVPLLWRVHKMHHTDLDFDVTTGVRFHPIEILLSIIIKFIAIIILGIPALAVVIFQIILTGTSMFTHANIKLPRKLDKILRFIIVTPNMHRIHHSVILEETNSNFGFNLSCWDRIFHTYQSNSKNKKIKIGLNIFRKTKELHLHKLLIQPFYRN